MRVTRLLGIGVAVLLLVAGSALLVNHARHGHSASVAVAGADTGLCRSALGKAALTEIATTVGEARATRYGPGYRPVPANAFPAAASTDRAAWCWTAATAAGDYTCFLVGPDASKIEIATIGHGTVPDRAPGAYIK